MGMRKGFTLIELIVVIIVIGILATIAVPQYLKATERAKGGKAMNAMSLIAQGEKLRRADLDNYAVYGDKTAINTGLASYIELNEVAADTDWNYKVDSTDTTKLFTITATRATGQYSGGANTLTLDQNGGWSGTGVGSTGKWTP